MACCIDWKQNRESDTAADKGHGRGDFKISQKEEGIEGMVVEDIAIGDFIEYTKPIEQSFW